jgi:hypothetical protein
LSSIEQLENKLDELENSASISESTYYQIVKAMYPRIKRMRDKKIAWKDIHAIFLETGYEMSEVTLKRYSSLVAGEIRDIQAKKNLKIEKKNSSKETTNRASNNNNNSNKSISEKHSNSQLDTKRDNTKSNHVNTQAQSAGYTHDRPMRSPNDINERKRQPTIAVYTPAEEEI